MMIGYQDITPSARERKRRKQLEYHAALDRDAGRVVEQAKQQPEQEHRLPAVSAKYKKRSYSPVPRERYDRAEPQGLEAEDLMKRLDHFEKYIQSTNSRMKELERTVDMLGSSNYEANVAMDNGDYSQALKLKHRVDELHSILASEIKSRNSSEHALEQRIMSVVGDGTSTGSDVVMTKLAEITDALNHTQTALQKESEKRIDLQTQVDAITSVESNINRQVEKVENDLEQEVFLNRVAADERKKQFELIQEAESKIDNYNERLMAAEKEHLKIQEENRFRIEDLEKKLDDQAQYFEGLIEEKNSSIRKLIGTVREGHSRDIEDLLSKNKSIEKSVATMESNFHSSMSESLGSFHSELRAVRDLSESNLQETKDVLSAEITSRRKAVGKCNISISLVSKKVDKMNEILMEMDSTVKKNAKETDNNLHKVASSLSEQLIRLQDATKTAARTLQMDQVSISSKLKNSIAEYTNMHEMVIGRLQNCENQNVSLESKLKSQDKKVHLRIDEANDKWSKKSSELEQDIEDEVRKREESFQKASEALKLSSKNISARLDELSEDFELKLSSESEARADAIHSSHGRAKELINKLEAAILEKLLRQDESLRKEISYEISLEYQTRQKVMDKLSSSLQAQLKEHKGVTEKLLAEQADENKESREAVQALVATQAQESEQKLKSLSSKLHLSFEDAELSAAQARSRLDRRIAKEAKLLAETDENLRALIAANEANSRDAEAKLEARLSDAIASCDEKLSEELKESNEKMDILEYNILNNVKKRDVELLERLKKELLEQLMASHVKAISHRRRVDESIRRLEVGNCLDRMVSSVVEDNVRTTFGSKLAAMHDPSQQATKKYCDDSARFLDKKLMAGFADYDNRLANGLAKVKKDVEKSVTSEVLSELERNDTNLLEELKKQHAKGQKHREQLQKNIREAEVSFCLDRIINTIVEESNPKASGSSGASTSMSHLEKSNVSKLERKLEAESKATHALKNDLLTSLDKIEVIARDQSSLSECLSNESKLRAEEIKRLRNEISEVAAKHQPDGSKSSTNTGDDNSSTNAANNPLNWVTSVDEKSGGTYYYNTETAETQWEKPKCLDEPPTKTMNASISEEIDTKVNKVGTAIVERLQKMQRRQKESEELIQSYEIPVLLNTVGELRSELNETVEGLRALKDEISAVSK